MARKKLYEEEWEESAELSLEGITDWTSDTELLDLPKDERYKVKERVFREFSGAGNCDDPDIYNNIALQALEDWVKTKLFEHRHWKYISYGHLGGIARWTTYSGQEGSRCYKGLIVIKCYIEWKKPAGFRSDRQESQQSSKRDYPHLRKA